MQVKGFDGRVYKIKYAKKDSKPSSYHLLARSLLKEMFPLENVLEETELPGTKEYFRKNLYADFFLISHRIIVEVHGEQHYSFIPFFHKNMQTFIEHKKRDRRKKEWAEMNNITYVELSYKEDIDEWRRKLTSAATS